MVNDDLSIVVFTAEDRCDRCGAQAYTRAEREDAASELLFCGHHRKAYLELLLMDGWTITDDYAALERLADNEGIPV